MRRRDFTTGFLLAGAAGTLRAQEQAKQHRIAIVIASGPVTGIDDPASRPWQAFWEELRRLGDVEGQNLTVERYSGEGRPESYADLAREVVSRNPDVIANHSKRQLAGPLFAAVSDQFSHLQNTVLSYQNKLQYAELKIRVLEERLRLVRIAKYGPGSEQLSDAQLELLELEPGVSTVEVQVLIIGRNRLGENEKQTVVPQSKYRRRCCRIKRL